MTAGTNFTLPVIENLSRREFISSAFAAALLIACGGDDDQEDEPTARRGFIDVTGKTIQVPNRPQRIVAIHDINGGAQLLSLGAPVVGIATRDEGLDPSLKAFFDVDKLPTVGITYEPDVEAILVLKPDLIVGEGYDGKGMFEDPSVQAHLEAIAPVVYIDTFRPITEVMEDFSELLGDAAKTSLSDARAEYESVLEQLKGLLGNRWKDVTASHVQMHSSAGTLAAWGPYATAETEIFSTLGVSWVPLIVEAGKPENGGYLGNISPERMQEFSADIITVDLSLVKELADHALFKQLPAVRAGQVIELREFFYGTHYQNYAHMARLMLEQLKAMQPLRTDIV